MQHILQLNGDLKGAGPDSISLKVSDTGIFMNEALALMQRLTIRDARFEALTDEERRSIHLLAVAIAAATTSHDISVKAEADMYADFIISSKSIFEVVTDAPFQSEEEKNNAYNKEVIRLTKEYDNATSVKNSKIYEAEEA